MMKGTCVVCLILICSGLVVGEVLYYCRNDTVILECDKLSNTNLLWNGPDHSEFYAIGAEINPNLSKSKKERLSIINDEAEQFDLKIERFSHEDEGNYSCVIESPLATIQVKPFHLKIARVPENLTVERENHNHTVYGFLDHPLNLTCTVIHGIPEGTLQWIVNNKTVNEGKTPLTYRITELQMNDHMKNYTCVVINNITKYKFEHTVQLFVYMPPNVWISNDQTINIREGKDMTLFCNSESNHGIIQLKWERVLNEKGSREDMGVNSTLVIRNIKRQEAGLFKCTVTNKAGNKSDYVSVVVKYPPTVQFKFEESKYSRELECKPKGIPDRYSFNQWEHTSEYLEHIRFLPDNGSGKLVIPFESGETDRHHDKGIYICNVSNNVSVSDKRFISANYYLNASGNPYFVTSNNKTQYCSVRRTCNINVDFVSFPTAKNISIIFNSTLKIKTNYILEDTKTIDTVYDKNISVKGSRLTVFLGVDTKEDYGLYTVVVKNSIEQGNFSVLLKNASRPETPKILQLVSTENQIDVRWQSRFDGGFQQSFVIQYRRHDIQYWHGIEVSDSFVDTVSINGLAPGTEYQIRMFATNILGDSDFTDQILIVTDDANSLAYLGLLILVVPIVVLSAVSYLHHKEGYISRLSSIRCCKWHPHVNEEIGVGENDQNPAVQNTNTPVYSSVESKNSRSKGPAVSYSVKQKCKPNLLGRKKHDEVGIENHNNDSGIRYHDKGTEHVKQSLTFHCDKKTSDDLNYIEVHFKPKPNERQFKIHGIDKETDYVEIDFSKKACAQLDTANDSESDNDSSSSDDVIW